MSWFFVLNAKNPIFSETVPFHLLSEVAKRDVSKLFIPRALVLCFEMNEHLNINMYN